MRYEVLITQRKYSPTNQVKNQGNIAYRQLPIADSIRGRGRHYALNCFVRIAWLFAVWQLRQLFSQLIRGIMFAFWLRMIHICTFVYKYGTQYDARHLSRHALFDGRQIFIAHEYLI